MQKCHQFRNLINKILLLFSYFLYGFNFSCHFTMTVNVRELPQGCHFKNWKDMAEKNIGMPCLKITATAFRWSYSCISKK